MTPILSICIPNFNHGQVLGQTLDAVFSQDLNGVEVLVSDNASNDNSMNEINRFSDHPQLRVFRQPSTIPMAENWNYLVKSANTPWIIVLCSDDILLPGSLARLIKAAQSQDAQAVFFEYDFLINQQRVNKVPFYQSSALIPGMRQAEIFLKGNNFPLSACMFRRELIQQISWFDESKHFCTDWHAWLNMSAIAKQVLYIDEPLLLYRHHAANETNRCVRDLLALEEVIAMKDEFISRQEITDRSILWGACSNNLKLAVLYTNQMAEKGFSNAAEHYRGQASELEQQLGKLGPSPNRMAAGAPYPLPEQAEPVKSANLCLT